MIQLGDKVACDVNLLLLGDKKIIDLASKILARQYHGNRIKM